MSKIATTDTITSRFRKYERVIKSALSATTAQRPVGANSDNQSHWREPLRIAAALPKTRIRIGKLKA